MYSIFYQQHEVDLKRNCIWVSHTGVNWNQLPMTTRWLWVYLSL